MGKGENGSFFLLRKGIGKPEGFPKRSETTTSNSEALTPSANTT